MANKFRRAALYLRVSTDGQTTENQRRELTTAAEHHGWQVIAEYSDNGISGAKGREKRPGLDALLKDATRGQFDVLMAWSVDRLGRSLPDLLSTLSELHAARVDLFLHRQAVDTTTPAGRALFQMLGVFAEFERAMIVERVNAGLARARAAGKRLGRPPIDRKVEKTIRARLEAGAGIIRTAKALGVGVGTVHRIRREMDAASGA
jgi:DNA invertase Pin-like site-specific DNA recombinase